MEDDMYEPGQPFNHRPAPIGVPYSTTAPRHKGKGRLEDQPEAEREPKKTFHVIGTDPVSNYIASTLAGWDFLEPVKLLVDKKIIMNNWEHEGKGIHMWKQSDDRRVEKIFRNRLVAEWVGSSKQSQRRAEHIENLIVALPCHQTKLAIKNIAHRIDNRTTICLVQNGLGVVEELNATLFEDPTRRPTFVLGHMTASLGYQKGILFSTLLRKPGKLYLTALERGLNLDSALGGRAKFHPPVERRPQPAGFLRTLGTVPGLSAGGYSLENFMVRKLPELVFLSIIDPLSVLLDVSYDGVLRNKSAIHLADELLEELFNVIWALPELNNSAKVVEYLGLDALRKSTVHRLVEKGSSVSNMLSGIRAGRDVDIDYLSGYFVKRGRELGIDVPQNKTVLGTVKSRLEDRKMQLAGLIPLEDGPEPLPEPLR